MSSISNLKRWSPSSPPPPKRARFEDDGPSSEESSSDEDSSDSSSSSSSSSSDSDATVNDVAPPPPKATVAGLVNSSDFYFEDGTLIIHVGGTRAFKLHRGLFERSSVFAGMFEVGTGSGIEAEEGCSKETIVKVDDNVKAWEALLRAMYDGTTFATSDHSLNELRAVLLLSDKPDPFSSEELRGILDISLRFSTPELLPMVYNRLATNTEDVLGSLLVDRPVDPFGWVREGLSKDNLVKIFRVHRDATWEQDQFFLSVQHKSGTDYHEHACSPLNSACRSSLAHLLDQLAPPATRRSLTYRAMLKAFSFIVEPEMEFGCRTLLRAKVKESLTELNQIIVDAIGGIDGYCVSEES